jgi:glycosyltransferase involved in cell wall biosynthesis
MRILFLMFRDPLNPYVGGGDIYINELAQGCAKHGHEVTILSSRFRDSSPEENIQNMHVVRLGSGFSMFLRVFTHYFRYLRGRFDLIVEEIIGGPRVPFFASLYMKETTIGILQQRHKEIFRQQFSLPIASLLEFLERLLALLYRRNQIVVNSNSTKEDLRGIGYPQKNMTVVYPGLPRYFFQDVNRAFAARQPRVICLTKIRRYKLIDHAVRAMKIVTEIKPDCELIIAGRTNDVEPEYENELRQLIRELGLSDSVDFQKDISESQKISLLNSSRALVLPSIVEGFGIVVIEANACGVPAIASDKVPAAVAGHNALIAPCFDIDSLSNNIVTLMSDEKKWRELSVNAFCWAKQFTWEKSVDKFISIVENHKRLCGVSH